MNPGNYRHKITIQERLTGQDSYGAPMESWTDLATAWASIEPLSGRELYAAQELNSEINVRIKMRYRPGVLSSMRILYGTRIFDILAVVDIEERHRVLELLCKEMMPSGEG